MTLWCLTCSVCQDQLMMLSPNAVPDLTFFLSPFLEGTRQEHTSGHTTGITLSSINMFLSYGIISVCVCVCVCVCVLLSLSPLLPLVLFLFSDDDSSFRLS